MFHCMLFMISVGTVASATIPRRLIGRHATDLCLAFSPAFLLVLLVDLIASQCAWCRNSGLWFWDFNPMRVSSFNLIG